MRTQADSSPGADLFASEAMALQAAPPPVLARMVSLGLCAMAVVAIVFACLAPIDIVVTAQGHVIPSGHSKIVQPLEAGVVKTIAVRDGQAVKAGDLLLELDGTTTQADRDRVEREGWEAQADVMRASALLDGTQRMPAGDTSALSGMPADILDNQQALLDSKRAEQRSRLAALEADIARKDADYGAIAASISQLEASLPLVQRKNEMRVELARTGHIAETGVIETRLELINAEKELAVQRKRLEESRAGRNAAVQQVQQAQAEFRARVGSERMDAVRRRDTARQELVKAIQRSELQRLRSPIDGIVQQLAVTTVGGVVTVAQPLMTIVPARSPMEVEAQVLNRDIGHIRVGQRAVAKIETFDFTRYGYIEGEVAWVGTDAVADQKLGPVYPVRIRLDQLQTPTAVDGRRGVVSAGMNVTTDVRVGERRMAEYFLAPMLRYRQEALRER